MLAYITRYNEGFITPHHCGGMSQDDMYKRDPAKTLELE